MDEESGEGVSSQDSFEIGQARLEQGPYARSEQHLWDALVRVDQLVRAHTLRWRLTLGAAKPADLWGMILVNDAEVRAYLGHDFLPPGSLPEGQRELAAQRRAEADRLETAISKRVQDTSKDVTLRLLRLQQLFGLSQRECDILMVCLLPELDGRYRRLFGYLQDDASRTRPSVELALEIVLPPNTPPSARYALLGHTSRLLAHRLLVISGGDEPLPLRSLRVDDRVATYLVGNGVPSPADPPDAHLDGVSVIASARSGWRSLNEGWIADFTAWWREQPSTSPGVVVFLHGPYGSGRRATAQAICAEVGAQLLEADAAALLRAPDWRRAVDLTCREAKLRGAALYWSHVEALLGWEQPAERRAYLVKATGRAGGLAFLAGSAPWEASIPGDVQPALRLELRHPSHAQRRELWEHYLPLAGSIAPEQPESAVLAEQLASSFRFTEGQIRDTVTAATGLSRSRAPLKLLLESGDLFEACRRQCSQRLNTLAQRVEPRPGVRLEDVRLPPKYAAQLAELWHRIAYRNDVYVGMGFEQQLSLGRGLVALFTGASGTGKTMAAERLASMRGVDLYKIDLSAIVSKYVGETEKNLSQLFAEAEDANAVLFFDEADALFGKRGEVKEAHDRWANIETNYLLQRIEEYDGVVILTSNLRQNIDEAFLRRIHVIVEFPLPDEERRIEIWRGMIPRGVAPAESEIKALARQFRLTGGNIKNIVLDAAFRACAAHEPRISQRHLVAGIAREFEKLGRPITRSEFEGFYAWAEQEVLSPDTEQRPGPGASNGQG